MTKVFDIVISINVHEKPEYLLDQVQNIKDNVKLSNNIVLNCNEYMYNELNKILDKNFILNPEYFDKRTYHGSLTKGIISNMKYSLDNYEFKYFLVMSSREFFYRELNCFSQIEENSNDIFLTDYTSNEYWHWPKFKNSKFYQYFEKNNLLYSHSAHEGMCFAKDSCEYIINFLNKNPEIAEDLYDFNWGMEEFVPQSICVNQGNYFYIGNGCNTKNLNDVDPNKFTYKRVR